MSPFVYVRRTPSVAGIARLTIWGVTCECCTVYTSLHTRWSSAVGTAMAHASYHQGNLPVRNRPHS